MNITQSILTRLSQSWGLWAIILSYYIMARFNVANAERLTVSDIAFNQMMTAYTMIGLFVFITLVRIYADTHRT